MRAAVMDRAARVARHPAVRRPLAAAFGGDERQPQSREEYDWRACAAAGATALLAQDSPLEVLMAPRQCRSACIPGRGFATPVLAYERDGRPIPGPLFVDSAIRSRAHDGGTPTRTRLGVIAILIGPNGAEKSTIVE